MLQRMAGPHIGNLLPADLVLSRGFSVFGALNEGGDLSTHSSPCLPCTAAPSRSPPGGERPGPGRHQDEPGGAGNTCRRKGGERRVGNPLRFCSFCTRLQSGCPGIRFPERGAPSCLSASLRPISFRRSRVAVGVREGSDRVVTYGVQGRASRLWKRRGAKEPQP